MGGANYMGGKRNFVRARAKDAAGKAQRNHFGKQRLGILAKCLSKAPLEKSSSAASVVHAVSRISLAHAKRDFQIQPRNAPPSEHGSLSHLKNLGLSSLHHRQHTPDRSSRASDKSTSHSSARSSRILDALDVSVRMLSYAYMRVARP
ncbi:hypothetical protein DAEQUDRAFT_508459 [Daedalea quercina L-15889]|uniref:Uncharacterized protein n=1 Tax=Daedalea quercina L-15889 TaxID=1314783 RepID=A0A165TA05_9APHY|nr:hypothetical protein DAEQUDRAFT_508459 [Daedalea quercina L-15889]